MFALVFLVLKRLPLQQDEGAWLPFVISIIIFISCFAGLAISFYPYVVPGKLTFYEAASARPALEIILYGVVIVVPIITAYTALSYYVFRGKADALEYY